MPERSDERPRSNGGIGAGWPSSFLLRLITLVAMLVHGCPGTARAQARSDAWTGMRVRTVAVELSQAPGDARAARRLEVAVRRAFAIWPGRIYDSQAIEFALSRVRAVPGVSSADVRIEFETDGIRIVVVAVPAPAAPSAETFADRLTLVDDGDRLLKARLSLRGAAAVSANQWFGNGLTLTRFNPRGTFSDDNGPNAILDLAPSVGMAGATSLVRGDTQVYVYGTFSYLVATSIGQDNNRDDARLSSGFEEAFAGVVAGGVTSAGSVWIVNASYGMQPYCIGDGMLLCQLGSSGGDRAADFAWPRWSGKHFLKLQLRWNDTLLEAYRFRPNDLPSSNTTLAGFNLDHDPGHGLMFGVTGLTVTSSEFPYFLPTGQALTRDGLRALHLRVGWTPPSGVSRPFARVDVARQTSSQIAMRALAGAAEAGWAFGDRTWEPSITARYTLTTGDDPDTARFERWDLLYSGDDVDTWVQGQLMKNIQFNSNLEVARVILRGSPTAQWRLTGIVSRYWADTANNIGGVIPAFDDDDLGTEVLGVAEHFLSRNAYLRFTAAALWPGDGVRHALPSQVASPWLVGIAQVALDY